MSCDKITGRLIWYIHKIRIYIHPQSIYIKKTQLWLNVKFNQNFLWHFWFFEYYHFCISKLLLFFVLFQEKPPFSYSSVNNTGLFCIGGRDVKFDNFSYVCYTISSVIFYFIFMFFHVITMEHLLWASSVEGGVWSNVPHSWKLWDHWGGWGGFPRRSGRTSCERLLSL